MKKKKILKKFLIFQETELSYISRVIKTNFLIFLVLKDKNTCFFPPGEPHKVSDFSPFSSVSFFTIFCSFCVAVLRVLQICYVFYFTLLPHISHSTAGATDLRELFLLSSVFYLTYLPDICHNLLL